MSPDPIYDGLKDGFSIYGYCRNNPLIYHDPDGLKTWFTPGTYNKYDPIKNPEASKKYFEKYDKNFTKNVAEKLEGEGAEVGYINWSGKNTHKARTDKDLIKKYADEIEAYKKDHPDEQINLVGHSHGKNFNIGLANELKKRGIKIDNFISLSGPNRKQYKLDGSNVKNYIEIFDRRDPVKNIFARYDNNTIALGVLALFGTFGGILAWQLPLEDPSANKHYDISSVSTIKRFQFHQATRIWANIQGAFE